MSAKTEAELKKLKLAELKRICVISSLPVSGSKQEVIERILAHDAGKSPVTVQPEEEAELLDEDDVSANDPVTVSGTKSAQEASSNLEKNSKVEIVNELEPSKASPATRTDISKMSQEERIALRKKRFGGSGNVSSNAGLGGAPRPLGSSEDWEKRLERAKRFGLPVTTVPKSDSERWKARAERFGTRNVSKPEAASCNFDDLERKRKRLERFGGEFSEEEKKKNERAIRFGLSEAKKVRSESEGVC